MRRLLVALACLAAVGLAAPSHAHAQSAIGAFCGTRHTRPPRFYKHVLWVWMENHSYGDIVGNPAAPFINALASQCGNASNFHNISHVSLPNYVGATSGLALSQLQPFLFDCSPGATCSTPAPSIFDQVPWKAYMESMTTNCQPTGFTPYAVRHNPPAYFTGLTDCATNDVPYSELQNDIDNDTLPAFAFVTPNGLDNMHDIGGDPGITAGDTWLATELPKILNSAAYQRGDTIVFLTWDEGEAPGFNFGEDCANNLTDESCHIPLIAISPYIPVQTGTSKLFNHYSLLKTTEKLLHARKYVGMAKSARVKNMRRALKF
jgi:hypothetical protein